MKGIFTERNIVVVLFVMVLITFSMAQKETKKIEHLYIGGQAIMKKFPAAQPQAGMPMMNQHFRGS